ncbi:MAG: glycosyltransferase [Proteobacteria bacterium]|nr:glycosyltransferase [Pseudomonadota bacterium]
MNILHVGKYYPPYHGGMETYLRDLAEEQSKNHKVTVVVHNHAFKSLFSTTRIDQSDKLKIIRQKSIRPVMFTPIMLGVNKLINAIIEQQNIDVIHISWPNPSAFLLLLNKKARKIPWVIQWQSDMVTKHSSFLLKIIYRFIKPLENLMLKQATTIIASTQYYLDSSNSLKKFTHKTAVIALGMNEQNIKKSTASIQQVKQPWQADGLKIFSLGRLTFYKNHKLLIQASQNIENCQLIITGEGTLKKTLLKLVDQHQLQKKVKLTGSLSWDQVNALYKSCDIFCLASNDRAESYGLVLLEAMIHNKIILVADTAGSGMKWLAENYNKGFLFKSDDVNDLSKQVKYIQNNKHIILQKPDDFSLNIKHTVSAIDQLYATITKN